MDDLNDAIRYPWADALSAAIATAKPNSRLFAELRALAKRAGGDVRNEVLRAADVGSVLLERDISAPELADALDIAPLLAYALVRGWLRPGLRGLITLADCLDVPIGTFFVDQDNVFRPEVRRYLAFRVIAPDPPIWPGTG